MIHVIATIEVAAGRRGEFLAAFRELVPQVQAEPGCLEYGPAVDLQTPIVGQSAPRANVVTIVEKWESVAALEDHLAAPHVERYRERVKDIVRDLRIQILAPV